jgi:hypothetical protein
MLPPRPALFVELVFRWMLAPRILTTGATSGRRVPAAVNHRQATSTTFFRRRVSPNATPGPRTIGDQECRVVCPVGHCAPNHANPANRPNTPYRRAAADPLAGSASLAPLGRLARIGPFMLPAQSLAEVNTCHPGC